MLLGCLLAIIVIIRLANRRLVSSTLALVGQFYMQMTHVRPSLTTIYGFLDAFSDVMQG